MLRVLLYLLPLILAIYALVDCIQTKDEAVRGLPKIVWIALIVLIWVIGPIAWLIAGRDRSGAGRSLSWPTGAGPSAGGGASGQRSRRVVAPDDDPDFLRQLGRDRDRRRREEDRPADPNNDDTGPDAAPRG